MQKGTGQGTMMGTEIIFEDADILVCRKPAGLPVQTRKTGVMDMESELKNHLSMQSGKKTAPYLGIIHRLDQPVGGILVFAKNKKAAAGLNQQLTAGSFGKYYLAEVYGQMKPEEGTLTDYMVKNAAFSRAEIVKEGAKGAKKAILRYEVLREYGGDGEGRGKTSLLKIRLGTGRFHQIRAQLSHAGHPILGDRKYNAKESRAGSSPKGQAEGFRGIRLSAFCLEFAHPASGKKQQYEIKPEWLSEVETAHGQ